MATTPPTQKGRLASFEAEGFSPDDILLKSFNGHEAISEHFSFEVDTYSEKPDLNAVLGVKATITLETKDTGQTRGFSGYVVSLASGMDRGDYSLSIKPWFWLLERSFNSRVYRKQSVKEIIEEVFSRHSSVAKFEWRTKASYEKRDFTAQYRETDAAFVSRLMEEYGLYYFYSHKTSKEHTMIICDAASAHKPFPNYENIRLHADDRSLSREFEDIQELSSSRTVMSNGYIVNDYSYLKSHKDISVKADWKSVLDQKGEVYEVYDYPGGYSEKSEGEKFAKIGAEMTQAAAVTISGSSIARGIAPGSVFTLDALGNKTLDKKKYLVLTSSYSCQVGEYFGGGESGEAYFNCSFSVLEASVQYRHPRVTPKPLISGPQTAVVTGPGGEEIWADEHCRVTVKFPWDQSDHSNENSSSWVRVSQSHAGKNFGAVDMPRIGEEVIVEFLNGDPDRPIITGRVYNDFNKHPYTMPDEKMVTGIKTNSTPGGGGYNEIAMDDSKGKEMFTVHAEKNMELTVKHNLDSKINNNEKRRVSENQELLVKGEQKTTVEKDQSLSVSMSKKDEIGTTYDIEANSNISIKSTTQIKLEAAGSTIELGPAGITIKTGALVKVNGSMITLN